MRKLLIALALVATSAHADLIAGDGKNELRLMNEPCMHGGILSQLRPEWRPKFKKAQAYVNGKLFYACWILPPEQNEALFVVFEDGDQQAYPLAMFKDSPGV